jgi:Cft2 family RNA processing exonuclease
VSLSDDSPPVELRCQVEVFDFSAHSQRDDIYAYIRRLQPKKVVLVHGDAPALAWFQQTLKAEFPAMEVIVPPPGVAVEL